MTETVYERALLQLQCGETLKIPGNSADAFDRAIRRRLKQLENTQRSLGLRPKRNKLCREDAKDGSFSIFKLELRDEIVFEIVKPGEEK